MEVKTRRDVKSSEQQLNRHRFGQARLRNDKPHSSAGKFNLDSTYGKRRGLSTPAIPDHVSPCPVSPETHRPSTPCGPTPWVANQMRPTLLIPRRPNRRRLNQTESISQPSSRSYQFRYYSTIAFLAIKNLCIRGDLSPNMLAATTRKHDDEFDDCKAA